MIGGPFIPVATNDEFLSLADVKTYLRVPGTAEDTNLTRLRNAGIDYLQHRTERNIIDRTIYYRPRLPSKKTSPICVRVLDINTITHFATYGLQDNNLDEPEDPITEFGVLIDEKPYPTLYPPADGWPFAISPKINLFKINVGISADNIPTRWQQAVLDYVYSKFYNSGDPNQDMMAMKAIDNSLNLDVPF